MILIHQRYVSSDPARQAELEQALDRNKACRAFQRIVPVEGSARRWTFADLFQLASEQCAGQPCVIANSDISFDESIAAALGLLERPGVMLALTRWDDDTAPSMEGRVDTATWRFYSQSQDAWLFRAGSLPAFRADFQLGIPRCENRLAFEAARAGVVVLDPALSIKARHHHATNVRTWRRADHYHGPLLFPRLTTTDTAGADGLVLNRRWCRHEAVVALGDGPRVEEAATRPLRLRDVWRAKVGVRSPFYLRRRSEVQR
ncbi:MAG: hypothetical protein WCR51_03515 [Planctomycetia bacterium]